VVLINRNNKKAFLTDGKSCDHWYRIVQRNRADLASILYTFVVMGMLNPALSLYFNVSGGIRPQTTFLQWHSVVSSILPHNTSLQRS
jgi:hypothetical protein